MSKFYIPKIKKVTVIVEGKPNQLCSQGMRLFEQYDEACKYFAEGKQKDNDVNEVQKQLQLHDLDMGEYLTNKYALWLDFRTLDRNSLHETGRRIENALEGISIQIEKKEETAGPLNAYIYLIMDAQLDVQNGAFISVLYQTKNFHEKPHTAFFVAPTRVEKNHLALNLLESEYFSHFDFIIIICPMLKYNETCKS